MASAQHFGMSSALTGTSLAKQINPTKAQRALANRRRSTVVKAAAQVSYLSITFLRWRIYSITDSAINRLFISTEIDQTCSEPMEAPKYAHK